MRRIVLGACAAVLGLGLGSAHASEGKALPDYSWSFEGLFGTFDRAALQRGLQIHREVCAGCDGLRRRRVELVARPHATAGARLPAEYIVIDGPDEEGEMFEREARASDRFPSPFANVQAAAAANNGAVPPDLSVITKARVGGPTYIRALLDGYHEAPADFVLLEGLSYNVYFPGNQIAMAAPLDVDAVEYHDGTKATVDQMAADVATFLMWAAEPALEERKQTGIKVILFLIVLTALLYAIKRKVWADVH
jgi:ubiquinol-cytochrome c reductase cytochrome c1 subunit